MIIIKGLPFKNILGIALFPFILLASKQPSKKLINHEKIHIRQQIELLVLPFYFWYLIEFGIKFIKYQNFHKAYLHISFEKEAYRHEASPEYLKKRKFWAFLRYL